MEKLESKKSERIITPEVVEAGLQKMREEAAKKLLAEFDALKARRDFLDRGFFKRERQRTQKEFSDDPDKKRAEIKDLHHERFLQAGAKLFHITEETARNDIFLSAEKLDEAVKEHFKKDKLPLSKDQDTMLAYAAEILDEDKQAVRDYLKNLFEKYVELFPENKEFLPVELGNYKNLAELQQLDTLVNGSYYLKSNIIFDLGYNIKTSGEKFELSKKEIRRNLDEVDLDLISYYPIILVKVKDKTLWDDSGHEDCAGFYFPEEGFKSMGIYFLETADKSKNFKGLEHEFQHAIRHRFFNKIKNQTILDKAALVKEPLKDLERIEHLLGARYDKPSYTDKIASGREKFYFKIKETKEKVEEQLDKAMNKDRDFWHIAQDEFCSYLERSKISDWLGRLRPFVTEAIYKDINERNLVSKEALEDFNILHDLVVFYLNAGFNHEEIADVIRTSKDFKTAQQRIKQNFRLNNDRVKKAIAPEKELKYKNMLKILEIIEKYEQAEYFFENFNQERANTLLSCLLLGSENKVVLVREITEDSRLLNEKNTQMALNKIVDMYVKNDLVHKYLQTDISKALESVNLMKSIQEYSRGVLGLRIELLEILADQPQVIRKIILRRLAGRINNDLDNAAAIKEASYSVNNELPSLLELRNLGEMKETWLFKDPADEANYKILGKWLDLPEEKRRDFIDRIKREFEKDPESPINVFYFLQRLVEREKTEK